MKSQAVKYCAQIAIEIAVFCDGKRTGYAKLVLYVTMLITCYAYIPSILDPGVAEWLD